MLVFGRDNDFDYSKFDSMDTDELKEILFQDSIIDDESDMDMILYIMEVVAKREKEVIESEFDADMEWKKFCDDYLDSDMCELSDSCECTEKTECIVIPFTVGEHYEPRKRHKRRVVTGIIVAVATVLLASSITAGALEINLFEVVAQWTKNIFGYAQIEDVQSECADKWKDAFARFGIEENLVPKWMPEGYNCDEIEINETPRKIVFQGYYRDNQGNGILVVITKLLQQSTKVYEKDESDVSVYSVNGIEHYIMSNVNIIRCVWNSGEFECSISGDIDVAVMKKIIDSIY